MVRFMPGSAVLSRQKRLAFRILVGKPQGKKRLGRPRPRWDSDSRVDVESSRMGSRGLDSHSSGLGQMTDCYVQWRAGFIKCEVFLDVLRDTNFSKRNVPYWGSYFIFNKYFLIYQLYYEFSWKEMETNYESCVFVIIKVVMLTLGD